jgi:hypothetical protein
MKFLSILQNKRAEGTMLAVGAIIAVIIAAAFAMLVGSIILSKTYDVAGNPKLTNGSKANVCVFAVC